jgi:hypothetical protein
VVLGEGGAAVGRVGLLVGKLGSVGESELVTGVPEVPDWHPASSAHAARTHAKTERAVIPSRLLSE